MGGAHEKRSALNDERRVRLTTRRPEVVSALQAAGVPLNSDEGMKAQAWGAALLCSRDAWLNANQRKLPNPQQLERDRERNDYRPRNSFGGR